MPFQTHLRNMLKRIMTLQASIKGHELQYLIISVEILNYRMIDVPHKS